MEGLELEPSMRGDFCPSQRLSSSYQGQGLVPSSWSRSSEVWADLPFKCVFPSPQSKDMLKHMGPLWALGSCRCRQRSKLSLMCSVQAPAVFFPSTQMQPWIQVSLVCHSQSVPPASAAHALFWIHTTGQEGPTWTLNMYHRLSCGGATPSESGLLVVCA